ncbi:hypothetical protein G5I_06024 [Acromyrmex echinatior]|uniref:Uncharacterized protein n=1 Tax=Acromyrmex echinatior TaxID=103372 RepID=F4WJZ0_ACREC|nr:hypothetical protein G5I_06024 [Acromyrmex echinatior]
MLRAASKSAGHRVAAAKRNHAVAAAAAAAVAAARRNRGRPEEPVCPQKCERVQIMPDVYYRYYASHLRAVETMFLPRCPAKFARRRNSIRMHSQMYNLSHDNIVITCDNMVHKGGAKLDEGIAFRASGATEGRVVRRFGTGRTRAAYIPCLHVYVHIHLSICVSAGALWELAVHCGPPVGGLASVIYDV